MNLYLNISTNISHNIELKVEVKDKEILLSNCDEVTTLNSGHIYLKKITEEIKLIILRQKGAFTFFIHISYKGIIIDSYSIRLNHTNIDFTRPMKFFINCEKVFTLKNLAKTMRHDYLGFICNEIPRLKKPMFELKMNQRTYFSAILELQKLRENAKDIMHIHRILRVEYLCFLNSENVHDDVIFKMPLKLVYETK